MVIGNDGIFHHVAFQDGGEGIEGGIYPLVGVVPRGIETVEIEGLPAQAVQKRRDAHSVAVPVHQFGRHGFHENKHNVGFPGEKGAVILHLPGQGGLAFTGTFRMEVAHGVAEGLLIVQQGKVAGLPAAQVQRAAYQIEHRMVAHLVEERVVAEEGGARADGGHIYTAPQTDYGQSDKDGGNGQHAHFLPEFSLPGVCLFQLVQVMVGQPHPPPGDGNEYA